MKELYYNIIINPWPYHFPDPNLAPVLQTTKPDSQWAFRICVSCLLTFNQRLICVWLMDFYNFSQESMICTKVFTLLYYLWPNNSWIWCKKKFTRYHWTDTNDNIAMKNFSTTIFFIFYDLSKCSEYLLL